MRSQLSDISVLTTEKAEEALSQADQMWYAGVDSHALARCSELDHLQSLSVIKSDAQRNEDSLYCTRRLCASGHEDLVMLNLIIRGFVTSIDILPLSKYETDRSPARLSQRVEIGAPASNSNFARALEGIKNIHASFSAQCPPQSLGVWVPPVSQSDVLRIDFVTPFLSSDSSLPRAAVDISHDPDGVFQDILTKSHNKFYTEDNKVDYFKMKTEGGIYEPEPLPPLYVRPGQLVELAVGFLVTPAGKAKLSFKRRFSSLCVLETSFQEEFNHTIVRPPKPLGKQVVRRFSPYTKRTDKASTMDEST